MSTLFSNNTDGGYRLRYLEVFNWGTFNGKVYKLQPDGRTSLLTGANGSGKTTLIDALLTILVPTNQRFYNQSSGAESKKERDENSYFWGYHGKTFSDLEEKSKTEQLRNKADNPYSVLLACFQNSGTQHTITLVQVRWFSNGGLQKVFIVSPYQLNIEEHFGKGHFDFKGDWKKKLVRQYAKTEIYNSFKEYAARFSELFGLKEKALPLFSKTVGIKVLGDLTNFIRQDMLEEADAEEQFKNLYEQYSNLLISHKAIQKDEKQLELLEPVIKNKQKLTELRKRKDFLEFIEKQMPFYLNKIEYGLLEKDVQRLERDISFAKKDKEVVTVSVDSFTKEKEQLLIQKAAFNIDSRINLLEAEINNETAKRNDKNARHISYVELCKQLNLDTDINSPVFRTNSDKLIELNTSVPAETDKLTESRTRLKIEQESSNQKIGQFQEQITSLLSRKNRIPDDLITARKRLLDILEANEDELPFVGELIKIKEAEKKWEDSIERLLHNFSMQLLVPEKFIKAANQFIYKNDMRTKLVYQKVERRPTNSVARWPADDDALINKLDLKESNYKQWVETTLLDRFNYYCTDDLEVFNGSSKAITSNGLIRNINRHEKDDRPGKWDESKYRLGWDNKATVQYYQQQKYNEEKKYQKISDEIRELTPRISSLQSKVNAITQLLIYKSYDDINWGQHAEKINVLNKQIQELRKSSDAYEVIVKQIKEVEEKLKKESEKRDALIKAESKLEEEFNRKNLKMLKLNFEELKDAGETASISFFSEEGLSLSEIQTLSQFENVIGQAGIKLKGRQKAAVEAVNKIEKDTITFIAAFVHPEEKIIREFPNWSGDVMNIKADLSGLDDLEDLYKTIQTQRLVEHKRRFREYMDKSMLDALTSYRTWLNNELSRIEDMIEELNVPLKKITFERNPDTYLQLEFRPVRGENEINIFRSQLNAAIPNTLDFAMQKEDSYREEVFRKIKDLITELQKEENWRRKVTDVRNWLTFSAREYSTSENKPGKYHDNTASYSGGQKAQFTYAILGAAIAHQFGIFQQGRQHKSLRFITVDEAFSKLDPEKSQFLMEFCAQLNLQILVVTPLDKINIAEPFIHAVHFVEIKNKKNSVLYNLTMEQYYEKKESFKQLADTNE
ncbi:MAG: AAA family ATPase [Chitinophagaceae bacterium]|nr:AAA family ATPase [Chitinophagaceae bacterium]